MARDGVPIIDMQKREGLAEDIVKAFEEWGCFRMVNHGVSVELMTEMKAVSASLLGRPIEIKMKALRSVAGKGYVPRNPLMPFLENLCIDDVFSPDVFYDCLEASHHQRDIINKYIKATYDLVGLLVRRLMEGYGLARDLFDGWCCQIRMNKYHYSHETVGLCGVDLHSDPTFFTILQDDENVNGLQVIDKYSGEIKSVDPIPNTLVVNIGDMGKVWSNGRFCSVKHRVCCFEPKTRYSIALFVLGPNDDKKVEAPPELVDSKHPRLYVPIDFKEYIPFRNSKLLLDGDALELYRTNKT